MLEKIQETAAYIKGQVATIPNYAIILGTGLGELVNVITDKKELPYDQIPNFPISTVEGHSGKLIFGKLGGKDVLVLHDTGYVCGLFRGDVHFDRGFQKNGHV